MYWEVGSTYNILVIKLEVKRSLGGPAVRSKDNIEKNLKKVGCGDV
jgi:hypothetical protein